MDQKYGVEQLKVFVTAMAHILNVASKVIHNGGLFALFGLTGPIAALKAVDFAKLKLELGELIAAERQDVEATFSQNLALVNANVQAKILGGVNYLEETVEMVGRGISLFNEGKDLVERVRAFFSV